MLLHYVDYFKSSLVCLDMVIHSVHLVGRSPQAAPLVGFVSHKSSEHLTLRDLPER